MNAKNTHTRKYAIRWGQFNWFCHVWRVCREHQLPIELYAFYARMLFNGSDIFDGGVGAPIRSPISIN